jgi:DNA adenine methylase
MAKWLYSLSPAPHTQPGSEHTGYTHRIIPCAGGLGELLGYTGWPVEGISETVNDINGDVSNFWEVIADPIWFAEFAERAALLPFSETAYLNASVLTSSTGSVDRALGFYILQRMGQAGTQGQPQYATPTSRLRGGMNENVSALLGSVALLPEIHARLIRVEVRNCDAIELIQQYDRIVGSRAFYYIDPPYLDETRVSTGEYAAETDANWHVDLLNTLAQIEGKFMLSGYYNDLYAIAAERFGWRVAAHVYDKQSSRAATKPQATEYVWTNY